MVDDAVMNQRFGAFDEIGIAGTW
jgi:hypothetical protein